MNPHPKKIAFFLPNIFTALNMACGLASIHFSIKARYTEAATILILGAIFDLVDGRLARLTGTSSNFGEQFDSMSDMTSFAMAPALLMHQKYFQGFGRLGIAVTFSYVLFGALRLARFNASLHKVPSTYFQGLPTPCAAMAIIGLVLCFEAHPSLDTVAIVPLIYTFFYGLLMVTNIPFYSFKDSEWIKKHKRTALFLCFIASVLSFIFYKVIFAAGMMIYTLSSLLFYIKRRKSFGELFPWKEDDDH